MPPKSGVKAPIQLLVEGADAQYSFIHFLNHMGFNRVDVEVQSNVEWRGHSRVYREAPDLIASLGLSDNIGEDDLAAFNRVRSAVLNSLDPSDIEVSDFGGVNELRGFLRAVWNAPNARTTIKAIGIVRDAETDTKAAFQSARDAIDALGLTAPDDPLKVVGRKPRIGILILPPNKPTGMLEDVCLEAVHDDAAMRCVEQYLECVQDQVPGWSNRYPSKAKVQAFLASRERPGLQLGQAADRGDWKWDHPTYNPIRQFVEELTKA